MSRCPVCTSPRIVIMINLDRRAFCTSCGSRWVQQGSHQRDIRRLDARGRVRSHTTAPLR